MLQTYQTEENDIFCKIGNYKIDDYDTEDQISEEKEMYRVLLDIFFLIRKTIKS